MKSLFPGLRYLWSLVSILLMVVSLLGPDEPHSCGDRAEGRVKQPGIKPDNRISGPSSGTRQWTPGQELEKIPYRVEDLTADATLADFAETAHEILTDSRGWVRAGFLFVPGPQAPYRIILAEGDEVDRLCEPYVTNGTYSCQNGPIVAINADRWRSATPAWPADLESYRIMLINHEVGHLLHLHHPDPQCPGAGLPAPVMAQQSASLWECIPNPWPLQWEIDLAAERREPLAPGYDHDPSDHRPKPPRVTR